MPETGVAETGAPESGVPGGADAGGGCVFCRIFASGLPDDETYVVWRGSHVAALCNAYPYAPGHVMVLPIRHLAELSELSPEESAQMWEATKDAVAALQRAYRPGGVNVGANLGSAAGAGVPGHLHVHAVPRWAGDTNFMTTVAETRVLPESLGDSWERLRSAWDGD
ncbi:MAG: HIT domain-containing protein [Actinomycetota bacterium]|nr:HIT domain-containing protein [Actinomycetota bacterium]